MYNLNSICVVKSCNNEMKQVRTMEASLIALIQYFKNELNAK